MLKSLVRFALPVFAAAVTSFADAAPFIIHETGVDTKTTAGAGTPLVGGFVDDPNWTVVSSPLGTAPGNFTPVTQQTGGFPFPFWAANPVDARWITTPPTGGNAPVGNYTFQTTFDLSNFLANTASITGEWAADDTAVMFLNGTQVATGPGFGTLASFTIPAGGGLFNAGLNILQVVVTNVAGPAPNPVGLLVRMSGDALAVPEVNSSNAAVPLVFMLLTLNFCIGRRPLGKAS